MIQVHNVSHITYRAWDVEKSFDFFVNTLGFYPQRRANLVYVGIGDTLVELGRVDSSAEAETQSGNNYVFGIAVENIEEIIGELQENGVAVVRPIFSGASFWGRQAVIDVPGGPRIALREWRPPDGPHFTAWTPE